MFLENKETIAKKKQVRWWWWYSPLKNTQWPWSDFERWICLLSPFPNHAKIQPLNNPLQSKKLVWWTARDARPFQVSAWRWSGLSQDCAALEWERNQDCEGQWLEEYPSLFCSKEIRRENVPTTNRNDQIRTYLRTPMIWIGVLQLSILSPPIEKQRRST